MILDVIKFSGFKGYKKFKRTLLDTNHKDLLEKIKTEENKILSQGMAIVFCFVCFYFHLKNLDFHVYQSLTV